VAEPIIRRMRPEEADACEAVLRALPDWFGLEEPIRRYRAALDRLDAWVAEERGRVVGFLAVEVHFPPSAEIHVMALRREVHRRGLGRALVDTAERFLRGRDVEFLQVKTLGPSRENEAYAATRRFYEAMGFRPLEETDLWGETNPCLILVKHLKCTAAPTREDP